MNLALLAALLLAAGPGPAEVPELGLETALAELDRQNLDLAQARSRAAEASAVVRQSTAALLPTVAAQGTYLRNDQGVELARPLPGGVPGPILVIQPEEAVTVTGSVRVPLVAPVAWYERAAARHGARAAGEAAEATRRLVRTGFAQSAYLAAAAEEVVAASERAVASAAELVRSAERRVAAGTSAPLDVLRSRAELVKRESELAGARAAVDRSRLALGVLLGRAGPVRVAVPDAAAPPAPELDRPADALAAEALLVRPEIAAAEAQASAAEDGVRSAWARLAPQLSISGAAFASSVPFLTGDRQGWRASLDLTWALYDGGFRYGRARQAEAAVAGARAAVEARRLAVVQEVEDARRDLAVARERLRLAQAQAALAAEAAASARRSFDAGVASSLDVLDANDRVYAAETGHADARARVAQAALALAHAVGRER